MIQAQLFINTGTLDSATGLVVDNWMNADLDDSVSIVLKDSIKKAKDVGKVFTTYTNPFNLPASKNNNLIFKRFSNNKVYDGFDPRRKYAARIKLNGADFKVGYIKLNKVSLVDSLPSYYNCQFFGELVSLKDIIGDSSLSDLAGLDKYTFPYTDVNTKLGAEVGFDVIPSDSLGTRQVSRIVIDSAPNVGTGIAVLGLNGVDYLWTVTGNVTTIDVASQLIDFVNTIEGYSANRDSSPFNGGFNVLKITSDGNGSETVPYIATGTATGLATTNTIVTPGNNTPGGAEDVTISENSQGMIKFPLLSHTRGFEYTKESSPTSHDGFHRILTKEENDETDYSLQDSDKLNRFDLKPAIKLPYIFDAIQETYPSIRFNTDWLFGTQTIPKSPIKDMYLWLHNRKGYAGYLDEKNNDLDFSWSRLLRYEGFGTLQNELIRDTQVGSEDVRPFSDTYGTDLSHSFHWLFEFTVDTMTVAGSDISLDIVIYDNNTNLELKRFRQSGNSDDSEVTCIANYPEETASESKSNPQFQQDFYVRAEVIADSQIGSFKPKVKVTATSWELITGADGTLQFNEIVLTNEFSSGLGGVVTAIPNINPGALMPKYKTMDFLSDLFKLYNLVAFEEVKDDGTVEINLKPYDKYIEDGTQYDVTKYVDIAKSSVERISPYSIVNYKFSEPKTFLAINQKGLTGDSFGNASFDVKNFTEGDNTTNSLLFDGGEYKVDVKLEKVMFERINDTSGNQTPIQWGWFVNDNKENEPEPELGKPLLMYINPKVIGTPLSDPYPIAWDVDVSVTEKNSNSINIPSNVNLDGTQTLHFNAEYDEYTAEINTNSLFKKYHSKYIESIYSSFAKKIVINTYLPPLIFNKVRLNDTIVVDNISYFIDEMDINITTGKTKFSLLRVTDITTRLQGKPENRPSGQAYWESTDVLWNSNSDLWNDAEESSEPPFTDFTTRVYVDGGTVEAQECVNEKLGI